jgi:DNA-binding NtrC family response regulator
MTENTRILVIDDERELCDVLQSILLRAGHEVECAYDGTTALARHAERPFRLVLADIKLPDINGLEILRRIKEVDESVVVILMTAFSSLDSALTAVKYQADNYLTKPFISKQDLLDAIEQGLSKQV